MITISHGVGFPGQGYGGGGDYSGYKGGAGAQGFILLEW
jgi:hypothetical protein